MFGTLYIFTLVGLLLKIVSDLTYVLVDPRIDFEAPRAPPRARAPPPRRARACSGRPALHARRRRLANFKANRRGYVSLYLFSALFVLSLLAEVIANDRPLLVRYDGQFYFPVLVAYPETDFGGFFATEADYRDPRCRELIEEKGWIVWPPIPLPLRHGHARPAGRRRPRRRPRRTGWAPTTRRATCWPA